MNDKERKYNLKFPRRNSLYYSNGIDVVFDTPKPSVTDVLDVLDKGGMIYRGMQLAAKFGLANYNQDKTDKEVVGEVWKLWRGKAHIGSSVHSLVGKYYGGQEIEPKLLSTDIKPYFASFLKFEKELKPKYLEGEKIVYCDEWAGRFDLLLDINGHRILCDIKTGGVYKSSGLQLSAYEYCFKDKPDSKVILQLKPDETYSFIESNESLVPFRACLEIFKWRKGDV